MMFPQHCYMEQMHFTVMSVFWMWRVSCSAEMAFMRRGSTVF